MAVTDESRNELHNALSGSIGNRPSNTLMEMLPPAGWADVATKSDLEHLAALTRRDLDVHAADTRAALAEHAVATRTALTEHVAATRTALTEHAADTRAAIAELSNALGKHTSRTESSFEIVDTRLGSMVTYRRLYVALAAQAAFLLAVLAR